MSTPNFNYGQSEIKAFNDAVGSGVVKFDEQAVLDAKRLYDSMIDGLAKIRDKLDTAAHFDGFGGFDSSRQLQAGFSSKATEGIAIVNQLIDAAMQLQTAYLRAGGKLTEADQVNSNRIRFLGQTSGGGDAA